MNQPSRELLIKLLDAWQRNPDSSRTTRLPISPARAPQYFAAVLPDDKEALHAGLQEAESAGPITLEWGKGFENHILKRISLIDGPGLANYLGIILAAKHASDSRNFLESELSGKEHWIIDLVGYILERWRRNKGAAGIQPGDVLAGQRLIRAMEAVSAGRHRNLDLRTFSTREFNDSKVMERMLSRFGSVWKRYHPSDLTSDELFETLGLVKFPQPLLLRGPVTLQLAARTLDCDGIRPFVGLPPQAVRGVVLDKLPSFILTIENLASFNRYAAEIQDDGLILYTAGFPAPGVADFLRLLDSTLPASIPFFHWGDIDEGGLKIFNYIQGLLTHSLKSHLMTADLLALYGQSNQNLRVKEVQRIADKNSEVSFIVEAMLAAVPPKTLEQENIDPLGVLML